MKQVIVFVNNNQSFALDISKIERIIEFENAKKIPQSSSYLLGVIQYNDKILPIIDLTKRFYHVETAKNEDAKIIIVQWKNSNIGILVDEVIGIQSILEDDFEESINNDLKISKEYILGFIKSKEDITILIDPDAIFDVEEEKELIAIKN